MSRPEPCLAPSKDISTVANCDHEPCPCQLALITGCDCGFYHDPIRRKTGHHWTDCKMIKEQAHE